MKKIYLAIADDHQILRNGLAMILESIPQYNLLYTAKDGQELLDLLAQSTVLPDVILLDIAMPEKNGFETCEEISWKYPEIAIIFLTNHVSKKFIETAVLAGGHGYLAKDSDIEIIEEAISDVLEHGYYYNEFWSLDLIKSLLEKGKIKHQFDNVNLTTREIEVLRAICEEKTDVEIAELLFLSTATIETYRKHLLKKIGVKKAVGLAIFAVKNNLI